MLDPKLREALTRYMRPARRMAIEPGDPGQLAVTKIGGVPWWPASVPRPHCPYGHAMSFIAQVRLSEVPELGPNDPGLLSFHYCQECSYEGRMAWGWSNAGGPAEDIGRYDVTIFTNWQSTEPDGLGVVAEDVLGARIVRLSDRLETPSMDDARDMSELSGLIDHAEEDDILFMLQDPYEFDIDQFPDLVHMPVSKLGGWPSWVQYPEVPRDDPNEPLVFVAQLSPMTDDDRETWCCGQLFLFVHPAAYQDRRAKMLIQVT